MVTPKQEMERKSEWFCGVKFFRSNFKVEWENGVWTKFRFLGSGFLFSCDNYTLIFTFFYFLDRVFFLNGFPNSIKSSFWALVFVCTKFLFLASGFLTHFLKNFLKKFFIWFFRNGFPNSFIVRFRSSFLLGQWKFFELYVRTCPAMFFYFVELFFALTFCHFFDILREIFLTSLG